MSREFKTISKKAREALDKPEGIGVEFKTKINGVKPSTLVAFSNSNTGGTILVGVEEERTCEGLERGKVVGCPISDDDRLQIQNMASDCIPPVKLSIFIENTNKNPFFRIEVPSGKNKPYCTKSGEYKIREDGRVRALHPDELLAIFMSKEGKKFLSQFKNAVAELEDSVESIDQAVSSELANLVSSLQNVNREVFSYLEDIFGSAEESAADASEANVTVNEIWKELSRLSALISQHDKESLYVGLDEKLDILINHLGANPYRRF